MKWKKPLVIGEKNLGGYSSFRVDRGKRREKDIRVSHLLVQ